MKKEDGYLNKSNGELQSVNLDLNKSSSLNIAEVDLFFKTCGNNQSFVIINDNIKVFKLILTGGSLDSNLFKSSSKKVNLIWEGGDIVDYDPLLTNRITCFVEKNNPDLTLTAIINVK